MRIITSLLAIAGMAATVNAQFSVGAGLQLHNDNFFGDRKGALRYAQFLQPALSANYKVSRFNFNAGLSLIASAEDFKADFSEYESTSHMGTYRILGDERQAHASFLYFGIRFGVDCYLIDRSCFKLAIGFSEHLDFLVKERYTNRYKTTYVYESELYVTFPEPQYFPAHYSVEPHTEESDFNVLILDPFYTYSGLHLKPAFHFNRLAVELQLGLNVFLNPRVRNLMAYGYDSTENEYDAWHPFYEEVYVGSELGICVKYRLSKD